jgi:hypothetical protein
MTDEDATDLAVELLARHHACMSLMSVSIALSALHPDDVKRVLNGELKGLLEREEIEPPDEPNLTKDQLERVDTLLNEEMSRTLKKGKNFLARLEEALAKG